MGDLSAHFDSNEFRCKHCRGIVPISPALIACLEAIRAGTGKPLVVVSGYRCPAHNKAVGGASASQHLFGTAADIPPFRATAAAAARCGARGIGTRGPWAVHVDVRATPATWAY
ncbi:YcbK family protein [Longimicrobium sp.]|jgi:uncharacterized protein YcbK (DUF882 family)|uniref:YcbK family protein n=1 Tax=Longimicrobium sp. TaxID=2029185 RepID=UPI0032C21543